MSDLPKLSEDALDVIWRALNSDQPIPIREAERVAEAKNEVSEYIAKSQESD